MVITETTISMVRRKKGEEMRGKMKMFNLHNTINLHTIHFSFSYIERTKERRAPSPSQAASLAVLDAGGDCECLGTERGRMDTGTPLPPSLPPSLLPVLDVL